MMKILFGLLFLIPICLLDFWFLCFYLFIFSFFVYGWMNSCMYFISLSGMFGCDFLSFLMIFLSLWICSLMILSSKKVFKFNFYFKLFNFMVLFLLISLFMTFSSMNLFIFYLFFEISLIPTLLLIVGWGYQPERLEAGLYLLFYTLLFSLPMMIMIFYLYNKGSLFLPKLIFQLDDFLMYFCMNMIFMVKIPMFMIHLWLPKAHVEAPVSGSMILAGVMLKLGGYGLLRVSKLFMKASISIGFLIVTISLVGGFFISLICLRQSDMKLLIAYSSVAHMGLALSGVMTLSVWGITGCVILMLGHGLCSSGLFCLANISYERFMSRSIYLNKGMINIVPSMSLWWFLLCACNMASPPSLNLLGEIFLINSILFYNSSSVVFLSLISFFGAVYSLFLYSFTQHGKLSAGGFSFFPFSLREYMLLFLHWLPLNFFILKGDFFFGF
nr:NADH dehydrogenase subunit 4 [Chlamisus sp. N29]